MSKIIEAKRHLSIQEVRLRDCQIELSDKIRPENAKDRVKSTLGFQGVRGFMLTTAKMDEDIDVWIYTFRYSVGLKCTDMESSKLVDVGSEDAIDEALIEIQANFEAEYVSKEKLEQDSVQKFCEACLLYTSPSPRDKRQSRMPSSA